MDTIQIDGADGLKLTADVIGDPANPPVVLFHGGGQTRHAWGTTLQVLGERWYALLGRPPRPRRQRLGTRRRLHASRRSPVMRSSSRGRSTRSRRWSAPRSAASRRSPPSATRPVRAMPAPARWCWSTSPRKIEQSGVSAHRRLHDRQPRRVRVTRRGGRRDRGLQPAPPPAQEPRWPQEEPPPASRRTMGLALGSPVRERQVRLARRDEVVVRRGGSARQATPSRSTSRPCSSAAG